MTSSRFRRVRRVRGNKPPQAVSSYTRGCYFLSEFSGDAVIMNVWRPCRMRTLMDILSTVNRTAEPVGWPSVTHRATGRGTSSSRRPAGSTPGLRFGARPSAGRAVRQQGRRQPRARNFVEHRARDRPTVVKVPPGLSPSGRRLAAARRREILQTPSAREKAY